MLRYCSRRHSSSWWPGYRAHHPVPAEQKASALDLVLEDQGPGQAQSSYNVFPGPRPTRSPPELEFEARAQDPPRLLNCGQNRSREPTLRYACLSIMIPLICQVHFVRASGIASQAWSDPPTRPHQQHHRFQHQPQERLLDELRRIVFCS